MEKLSKKVAMLAERLEEYPGGLTAKDLECTYVDIHPLIERKYVTVTSIYGVAIYVLTEAGKQWLDNRATGPRFVHPRE